MVASLTFFPVGNGGMTLAVLDNGQRLLIDLHVRTMTDDKDDTTPDVMTDLRGRLKRDEKGRLYVDGFLLSHPDKDHILGLMNHFHLGPPEEWDSTADKIIIREMWSSPVVFRRASKKFGLCDDAKAWASEARRRVKMYREQPASVGSGSRIQIMGEDQDGKTDDILGIVVKTDTLVTKLDGVFSGAFEGRLLAPLPQGENETLDDLLAKNRSSVILRFSLRGGGYLDKCRFLTGGDAEVAIWERLRGKHADRLDWLSYDILYAPHHCSWHSLSYDSYSAYGEDAKVCANARSALAQIRPGAIVVASSNTINPDEPDPPSDRAKREYVSIVGGRNNRFVNTTDVWEAEGQALSYEITAAGTTKVVENASKAAVRVLGIGGTAAQPRPHG